MLEKAKNLLNSALRKIATDYPGRHSDPVWYKTVFHTRMLLDQLMHDIEGQRKEALAYLDSLASHVSLDAIEQGKQKAMDAFDVYEQALISAFTAYTQVDQQVTQVEFFSHELEE